MRLFAFCGVSRIIGIKTSPPNNKHNAVGENPGRPGQMHTTAAGKLLVKF